MAIHPVARIGCSGWQYRHWRGSFYPADLPASRWFDYYAARFDTVEINNTFYRLPEASTFSAWRAQAPPRFLYAVKASRFLTHMKKLKNPVDPLRRLFQGARLLRQTLGPVLYQLPPRWRVDPERLAAFLRALPTQRQHAVEFRDDSWYRDDVFALLHRHGVALCLHDMAGSATGKIAVGPFVYVRFHGPQKYSGKYRRAHARRVGAVAGWATAKRTAGICLFQQRHRRSRAARRPAPAARHHTVAASGPGPFRRSLQLPSRASA